MEHKVEITFPNGNVKNAFIKWANSGKMLADLKGSAEPVIDNKFVESLHRTIVNIDNVVVEDDEQKDPIKVSIEFI